MCIGATLDSQWSEGLFAMECVILHRSDDFSPTKMGCSKRSHKHILCRENRLFQNEQMEQEEPRPCIQERNFVKESCMAG